MKTCTYRAATLIACQFLCIASIDEWTRRKFDACKHVPPSSHKDDDNCWDVFECVYGARRVGGWSSFLSEFLKQQHYSSDRHRKQHKSIKYVSVHDAKTTTKQKFTQIILRIMVINISSLFTRTKWENGEWRGGGRFERERVEALLRCSKQRFNLISFHHYQARWVDQSTVERGKMCRERR